MKWFADFDYASVPKTVSELSTGTFWSMFGLAVVVLLACVVLDKRVSELRPLQDLSNWFNRLEGSSLLVMRVATFATTASGLANGYAVCARICGEQRMDRAAAILRAADAPRPAHYGAGRRGARCDLVLRRVPVRHLSHARLRECARRRLLSDHAAHGQPVLGSDRLARVVCVAGILVDVAWLREACAIPNGSTICWSRSRC